MPSDTSFQLFTSLRYDPILLTSEENSLPALSFVSPSPFYMLVYHRDRMLEAAQHFDFHAVAKKLLDGKALHLSLLHKVREWVDNGGQDGALKLRLLFDESANLSVDFMALPPVPLATLYPSSLDPPRTTSTTHPANYSKPSPLAGEAVDPILSDSLAGESSPPTWAVKLDSAPTLSSPFTLLKTTHRDFYDASRERALPENLVAPAYREVMLYNECQELTEGSMTSLYVFRGGKWVTPPVGVPAGQLDGDTLKTGQDEGELRKPFAGRWGHSVRSSKVGAGGQRGTSRRWALGKGYCMEEPVSVDTVEKGEGVWVSNGVRGFGYGIVVD
ncbi:hypothetical protein BDV95DRAFT_618968 [Massariosphaeria phaeospora]|uniref:Aminotransferase class IV-domain-containing protein n=1 Tax=Massariosphaeria phaeospora TaxID=100035 RepID=A0A7C8I7X6_9PLEO|nr:hypothetical protein BDV95DRAFT_618968 [Massariosphaeria phaeospora]